MGWSGADSQGRDFRLGRDPDSAIDGMTPIRPERRVCSAPFKSLAVNFNGQVSVCCVDWSLETVVGDVSVEPLREIWNGAALARFRDTHLRGRRQELAACRNCTYMLGFSDFEDLDTAAAELLEKLRDQPK